MYDLELFKPLLVIGVLPPPIPELNTEAKKKPKKINPVILFSQVPAEYRDTDYWRKKYPAHRCEAATDAWRVDRDPSEPPRCGRCPYQAKPDDCFCKLHRDHKNAAGTISWLEYMKVRMYAQR